MKCGATGQMIGLDRGVNGVVGCVDRVEPEGDALEIGFVEAGLEEFVPEPFAIKKA
jgi:hypothetical protein